MMKQTVMKYFEMALMMLISMVGFSSCEVYTTPPPPGGGGSGYATIDPDIVGTWELAYVNGHRVNGYEVNYLDFYNSGRGYYYYYDYGMEYELGFDFWSEYAGDSSYLFINYYDGTRAEMAYWFSPDYYTLYLQWWEGGHKVTYTYYYVTDMYWSPQKDTESSTFALRPGATTLQSTDTINSNIGISVTCRGSKDVETQ